MDILHIHNEQKGSFRAISEDGRQAGEMTYTHAGPGKFIIDHTEVDPAFKGQRVGHKMLMAAVEYARQEQLKIMPLCPFAKSVFDKSPEIRDVLF